MIIEVAVKYEKRGAHGLEAELTVYVEKVVPDDAVIDASSLAMIAKSEGDRAGLALVKSYGWTIIGAERVK